MPNYFNNCSVDWKNEFKIVSEFYPNLEGFLMRKNLSGVRKLNKMRGSSSKKQKSSKDIIFRYFLEEKIKEFEENISWASPGMFSNDIYFISGENDLKWIIDKGKSKTCEFKESLSLDVRQTKFNPIYKLKTISNYQY